MDHLEPIEPESAVREICEKIAAAEPSYAVKLELEAFAETKTRHDARRLVLGLRRVDHKHDLADELQRLLAVGSSG